MNDSAKHIGYFGGHDTFVLRSSWLSKGCKLLAETPEGTVDFSNLQTSDSLGIGKNMSKSLAFWLRCTKLANKEKSNTNLQLSDLGHIIYKQDPYFQNLGSIWFLHSNLTSSIQRPEIWSWAFNANKRGKFNALQLQEDFQRHISINLGKMIASKTISNDVRCLLNSYGVVLAEESAPDPERTSNSPLQRLNLLTKFPKTATYEFSQSPDPIPIEILGYHLSSQYFDEEIKSEELEVSMKEVLYKKNSLGQIFNIKSSDLLDIIDNQNEISDRFTLKRVRLAEEWGILFSNKKPSDWLKEYYLQLKE